MELNFIKIVSNRLIEDDRIIRWLNNIVSDSQIFFRMIAIIIAIIVAILLLSFIIYIVRTKKIIKLLPDKLAYAEKIEFWLNKMAQNGLILKRVGQYFALFERNEPKDIKYRVMAYDGDYFEDQVINTCNKAGWEIIEEDVSPIVLGRTAKSNKYYVFKTNSEQEPHKSLIALNNNTGVNNKRIKEKKLHRTYKTASKTFAILAALGYIIFFSLYVSGILLTFSAVFLILSLIQKKEKKRVDNFEKQDLSDYELYKEYIPRHIIKTIITIILKATIIYYAIVLVVSPYFLITKADLDDVNNFIRIEDVQQAYELEIEPSYGWSIPSPFTPTYYKAEEMGLSKIKNGNTKRIEYKIVYSKSVVPFVTYISQQSCVFKKLNSTAYQFDRDIEETQSEYFDKIIYLDFNWARERTVEMCLINNTEIIYIYYRGDKTSEEIIENIEDTLYRNK